MRSPRTSCESCEPARADGRLRARVGDPPEAGLAHASQQGRFLRHGFAEEKPMATALLLLSSTRLVMRRSARYPSLKEARKWGAGGGASLRNETGRSAQCDRAAWRRRSRACRPYEGARGGVPDRGGAYAELSRLRRRCNSPRAVGAPVGKSEMSPKDWRGGLAAIRSRQSGEQRPLGRLRWSGDLESCKRAHRRSSRASLRMSPALRLARYRESPGAAGDEAIGSCRSLASWRRESSQPGKANLPL